MAQRVHRHSCSFFAASLQTTAMLFLVAAALLLPALAAADFSDAVTSNDAWHGQQVVHLNFAANEGAIERVLAASNITDLWRVDHARHSADVVVPASEVRQIRAMPEVDNLVVSVPDLGEHIKQTMPSATKQRWDKSRPLAEFFEDWRDNAEVEAWSLALCELHPLRCAFNSNIGTSVEGRPIFALSMGGVTGGPAVYHQSLLHAREWITTSTVCYMMMELLESDDPAVIEMLASLHHVFVPIANPDGYEFTFGPNRLWRKNRQVPPSSDPTCFGVDLNRNWEDGNWGGAGSSANPCSDIFRGPVGMSEPETQSIERLLMEELPTRHLLIGAIDWHSFGKLILGPYGWARPADALPPNDADVTAVRDGMAQAILESPTGSVYVSDYATALGVAAGGCDDWLYTNATNQRFAYTFESRSASALGGGFVLPPSEIVPTGIESAAALLWFGEEMLRRHQLELEQAMSK